MRKLPILVALASTALAAPAFAISHGGGEGDGNRAGTETLATP